MSQESRGRIAKFLVLAVITVVVLGVWWRAAKWNYGSPAWPDGSQPRVQKYSWAVPSCARPDGEVPVTFSYDAGRTVIPIKTPEAGTAVSTILALDEPGALVVFHIGERHNVKLFRSRDAGCTWSRIVNNDQGRFAKWPQLVKGAGGRVYGFIRGTHDLFMVDGDRLSWMQPPGPSVYALGADRRNPGRLLAADGSGRLWESVDDAKHWATVGREPPIEIGPPRVVVFDPSDIDHAAVTSVDESFVTRDGGKSWARVVPPEGRRLRGIDFSPIDGRVAWGWSEIGVSQSTDGGTYFAPVPIPQADQVSPGWIKADPANVNGVLVHTGAIGPAAKLLRFDVARQSHEVHSVGWSIFEPSPATVELWYVGLDGEPRAKQ